MSLLNLSNDGLIPATPKSIAPKGLSGFASDGLNGEDTTEEFNKNDETSLLKYFGKGIGQGTLGIMKGTAELGVATGEQFNMPGMVDSSQKIVDYFAREMAHPDLQVSPEVTQGWQHPVKKSLYLVGNAVPSVIGSYGGGAVGAKIGAAKGLSPKLTGYLGAVTGSIPLGTSIAGSYWAEGVEAGKDRQDPGHYAMALTDGVVQSFLEAMPFMGWMKGGKLSTRVLRGIAQEGGEEVVQGLFENSMKVVGWKGTENLYNDMMEGLADSFVAGALTGGALGAVGPISIQDQKYDLVNKMTDDTYKRVTDDGVTNPDGTPMSRDQVRVASQTIVDQVHSLDGIVYDKLLKKMREHMETKSKGVASGRHETVERTKFEDGEVVSTKDDTYAFDPLDKTLPGEAKRKQLVLKAYEALNYKSAGGKIIPWAQLPSIMQYNILNNPKINVAKGSLGQALTEALDEEFGKNVIHTNPSGNTNPHATVYFGRLKDIVQNWISGREETKQDPEIPGDIWLSELPRVLKEQGIDPMSIEFIGKGSDKAMSTFISEWNLGNPDNKITLKKKKVSPFTFNKTKERKLLDKAQKALDKTANINNKGREKQIAYKDQEKYIKYISDAVRSAWASVQSITKGNAVLEATTLLNKLATGKVIDAKGLKITTPQDIAEIFSVFRNPKLEVSQIVYVRDGEVVSHEALSIGSPNETTILTGDVRRKARKLNAEYYIIHNHPSGNIEPSSEDLDAQNKFKKDEAFSGQLILDHKNFTWLSRDGEIVPTDYKTEKIFFHKGKAGIEEYINVGSASSENFRKGKVTLFLSDGVYLNNIIYLHPGKNLSDQIGVAMIENVSSFYYLGTKDVTLIPGKLPKGGLGLAIKNGNNMRMASIKDQSVLSVWTRPEAKEYVSKLTGLKVRKNKKGMRLNTSYDDKILRALARYGDKDQQQMAEQLLSQLSTTDQATSKMGQEKPMIPAEGKTNIFANKQQPIVGDSTGKGKSFKSAEALAKTNKPVINPEEYINEELPASMQPVGPRKRFGNADELNFLLDDKRDMDAMETEGQGMLRSIAVVDLLNKVYESGELGKKYAEAIHAKLETIKTTDNYTITESAPGKIFSKDKITAKNRMTIESLREFLWYVSNAPYIKPLAITADQVRTPGDTNRGKTVKEQASAWRYDSYRMLRHSVNYLYKLTGWSPKKINKMFGFGSVKDMNDLAPEPDEQQENLQPLVLPVGSPLEQRALKNPKKKGWHPIRGGLISEGGLGTYPWFAASGKDSGKHIGVIPHLWKMVKEWEKANPGKKLEKMVDDFEKDHPIKDAEGNVIGSYKAKGPQADLIYKIRELEDVVKWLVEGEELVFDNPVLDPKDFATEAEYKLAKINQPNQYNTKKFEGIPQLLKEFLDERRAGVRELFEESGGVYFPNAHYRKTFVDGKSKQTRIPQGAYKIVRDPKDAGRGKLTKDLNAKFDEAVGYEIVLRDLEKEWVVKKKNAPNSYEKARVGKKNVFINKKTKQIVNPNAVKSAQSQFSKSSVWFSEAQIEDIISNDSKVREKPEAPKGGEMEKVQKDNRTRYEKELDQQAKDDAARIAKEKKSPAYIAQMKDIEERTAIAHEAAVEKQKEKRDGKKKTVEMYDEANPDPYEDQDDGDYDIVSVQASAKTFDGKATKNNTKDEHFSEEARYESGMLKVFKKAANFFIGNEDQTIKFLGDWVFGGSKKVKQMGDQISPAERKVMDEVVKTAVSDKNYIKLAQMKGFQVQDLIRQQVRKEMKKMYPNASKEQLRASEAEWLDLMNDAAEEVIQMPGNTNQYTYSDLGVGGPHEVGTRDVNSERDVFVKRMTTAYTLKNKKAPSPQMVNVWKKYRPAASYFNMLSPGLQNIILWNKTNIEDPIFFTATSDVLSRADNVKNRRSGYSPRMFMADIDAERSTRGVQQTVGSQRVQAKKYRTYGEFAEATTGGLAPVRNYAANAGWYTKEYLIRINQNKIIEQFKSIRNPGKFDIGMITYTTDVEKLAKEQGYTGKNASIEFLRDQGYDEVKNAEGLSKHWRGEFFRPWVHRSVKHAIERFYLNPGSNSGAIAAINKVNGLAKKSIMAVPYQFALQIASSSWLWMSPKVAWKYGIKPMFDITTIAKGIKLANKRATKPFEKLETEYDHEKLDLFIKHGLRSISQAWMQKALYDSAEYSNHPLDRNKIETLWDYFQGKGGLDSYIFEQYMSKVIYRYADAMMTRFTKQSQDKGLELTKDEIAALAVKFVNDTSGTLPAYIYGAEGQWLQFMLFARDFTVNFDRQMTGAAYNWKPTQFLDKKMNAYKLHGSKTGALNPFFHGESTQKQMEFLSPWYRKHLFKTSAVKLMTFGALQALLWNFRDEDDRDEDDKWIWKNEKGKQMMIKLPGVGPDDHDYFLDPIIWRELSQFQSLLPKPHGKGILGTAQSKMAYSLKMMFDVYANEDYMGTPIRDEGEDVATQATQLSGYFVKQLLPSAFKKAPKELGDIKTDIGKKAAIGQIFGAPIKRSSFSRGTDEDQLRAFRKRMSSQTFRKGTTRRKVIMASNAQLYEMLIKGEISADVYRNTIIKRQNEMGYFYKNNYKSLLKDETKFDILDKIND